MSYVSQKILHDPKSTYFYSATHEEVNGFEYIIFKLNSSDKKFVEAWSADMIKYFYDQHRKGFDVAIHLLDITDMRYRISKFHAITTLQVMGVGEDLGFKEIHIFVILPDNKTGKIISMAINSVTKIITTYSGGRYAYKCSFVKDVVEGRKKILKIIERVNKNKL